MATINVIECLNRMVELRASDLHIKAPTGPIYRIDGYLCKYEDGEITAEDVEIAFNNITSEKQKSEFCKALELDFSYSIPGVARYRINVEKQRGTLSLAIRLIPFEIPTIESLKLPDILKDLIMKPRGLVIVSGPTGSGKSTTLATMVQHLNANGNRTIITIEDPIEYVFTDDNCVILQRELGADTRSFPDALRSALRHDPDVIVVGEMRDYDTVSTVIAAAETGHLVLGTLHTIDAPQAVDRLVDLFPPSQQHQVRIQFSQIIEAVVCQTLLPKACGHDRIAAFEIMLVNDAIRNQIREGRTFELHNTMQMNMVNGMKLLDNDLARLVNEGVVKKEIAITKCSNRERFERLVKQASNVSNLFVNN
ncbi:MAG: PilT/PilU family type 4a pilus ATPase [Dehalococcoidales bacterium]|nr:PilT/PilU family type 4a pilus ATPase [Dehalococcoidales bacterium]